MTAVVIRLASTNDCDTLAAVHVTAWHESYTEILPAAAFAKVTIPERTAAWMRVIASANHPVFVAECDGEIVGFADGGPARSDQDLGQEMQVYALYLLNRAKRQRIGTQLLRSVMCQFLTSGASSACVWTLRDAIPARRFYE
jgi:L-amino acid N-acyltransferase YncA